MTVAIMTLTTHLLRRSMHAAHSMHTTANNMHSGKPHPDPEHHISPLAALIFFLTGLVFLILLFSIGYTYGHVIPTLCMIESPETAAYVPVGNLESGSNEPPAYTAEPTTPKPAHGQSDQEMDGQIDDDVLLITNKPITASLRATVLHLRARAGYWSRFRGLSMYLVWNMATGFLISIMGGALGNRLITAVAAIIAETALATLHMTWVHIVISDPSEKKWYQRIPSIRTWPKIAPAVAIWATTNQIVAILPTLVTGSFGSLKHMKHPEYEPGRKDLYAVGAQAFLGMFLMLALFLLLQIPASVTLVRVAASMLPEEDETIVPFDRTFGGKTTPTILGGQGKIGLVEAWRSFAWASRMRLVKLMIKVAVIMMSVWVLFTIVLVTEAHLLFGDRLGEVMKTIHGVAGPR
ncbi:hypothetical protein PV10_02718 [Exophiala mesophila]|uniref:Ubiquitin carrier protein n=1 Tax=Exophiala mesophila TaxID=212818 RepID=A0A0D1WZV6_EXOME|nr:uncharacterized protein PV10_02718 [Exophiala mesophila]KIV95010.1 hypothetical protein PV10_02718 [Exophiala mesophila]